jgi:hypothetical protein
MDVACSSFPKSQIMNNPQTLHLYYMGYQLNVLYVGLKVIMIKESSKEIL